ncbi:MAG: tetratricopeptide repeat protein [Chitinivibrionales bacterium]|nr:tetratricopeptide repeat protein [Chitinivibrionales bacterium]
MSLEYPITVAGNTNKAPLVGLVRICCMIVGFCGIAFCYEPFEDIQQKTTSNKLSIITLRILDRNRKVMMQGNAFFISNTGDAITSRHLFDKAFFIEAVTTDGKVYPVDTIVCEDKEGDLIWISVPIPKDIIHPLDIKKTLPSVGEQIMVMVSATLVSDGEVSSIISIPNFGNLIKISAPVSQGATGSPVVDMNGEVVGVAVLHNIDGQNHVHALPGSRIIKMEKTKGITLAQWQSSRLENRKAVAEELYAGALPFIQTGKYEDALKHLIAAVKKYPGYVIAYTQLAYCYKKLGALQEAGEALEAIIRISPKDTRAYYNLALNFTELGLYNDAMITLREALKIDDEFPAAYTLMAWIYNETGSLDEAVKPCKKAISIKPDFDYAHVVLGTVYMKRNQFDWAVNSFKQAININPENIDAYLNLAQAYNRQGMNEKELEILSQANKANPGNFTILKNLGEVCINQEEYYKAKGYLKKAREINSNDPDVLYNLGMAYLKGGDKNKAMAYYKTLRRIDNIRAEKLKRHIK